MRIACVGYMHGKGGAERQLIMLANALAERGHEVYIIALAQCNLQYVVDNRVQIVDLSNEEKSKRVKFIARYDLLHKKYKELNVDVSVHFWLQTAYLTAFMPKKIVGKIIYSERNDPADVEYTGIVGLLRKCSFGRINGFVFQSEAARNYFDERIQKKSVVIPNPVEICDNNYKAVCEHREKKIVSAGRLVTRKNQKLLIEAFSKIAADFPDYSLEIYGEGDLRKALEIQIAMLHLDGRVRLPGNRDDIFKYIYTASLFVLSSEFEGMPNALIEAMALGVPCISTDCKPGGAKALISNGENGFVVPLDDVDELANRMSFMLMNRDAAEKMAQNAMNIRNTHAPKVIYDIWENFIMKIVGDEK